VCVCVCVCVCVNECVQIHRFGIDYLKTTGEEEPPVFVLSLSFFGKWLCVGIFIRVS